MQHIFQRMGANVSIAPEIAQIDISSLAFFDAVATWVEEGVQGVHFGIKSSTLKTFASANDLSFASPNFRDLSNKDLGKLITKGTVYVECHMTVAKIKKMIAQAENRKAFFKEHK